jgi:hypothetical protein
MTALRMSISLEGEIQFETSRLPLTSDLESGLFDLSRVRTPAAFCACERMRSKPMWTLTHP